MVSASVASVYEICDSGTWAQHTLLDDRDMLLSGDHLWQSVLRQYFDVCGRRTLSAVRLVWTDEIVGQIVLSRIARCACQDCASKRGKGLRPTPEPLPNQGRQRQMISQIWLKIRKCAHLHVSAGLFEMCLNSSISWVHDSSYLIVAHCTPSAWKHNDRMFTCIVSHHDIMLSYSIC